MTVTEFVVRRVDRDQWDVVAWLWQDVQHDLASGNGAVPYPDGRYQRSRLDGHPTAAGAGYLAWAPHPRIGDDAPVGFATVTGIGADRRAMQSFFVVPAARRDGVGRRMAAEVIAQHPGPWEIAFQHENVVAGSFWRTVASEVWGDAWDEVRRDVPHLPHTPADHVIQALP